MKLPIALIKTWLELSSTNDPESSPAYNLAIKKIFYYFGSYRDAELYIKKNTNHQ
jgi:hypothetical protein